MIKSKFSNLDQAQQLQSRSFGPNPSCVKSSSGEVGEALAQLACSSPLFVGPVPCCFMQPNKIYSQFSAPCAQTKFSILRLTCSQSSACHASGSYQIYEMPSFQITPQQVTHRLIDDKLYKSCKDVPFVITCPAKEIINIILSNQFKLVDYKVSGLILKIGWNL